MKAPKQTKPPKASKQRKHQAKRKNKLIAFMEVKIIYK